MKKIYMAFIALIMVFNLSVVSVNAVTFHDSDVNLYKDEQGTVQVFTSKGDEISITDNDVYLMAQVVYAESRSEPFEGKVAVASVILNRARDPRFPKTIEGVIKQKGAFSCVSNGKIYVTPDDSSYRAVLQALSGDDPTGRAVFFYNPKIATSSWMKNIPKDNVKSIGNHTFFVVNR